MKNKTLVFYLIIIVIILFFAGALMSINPQGVYSTKTYVYEDVDGKQLVVTQSSSADKISVVVPGISGGTVVMDEKASSSGPLYSDGSYDLMTLGDDVILRLDGRIIFRGAVAMFGEGNDDGENIDAGNIDTYVCSDDQKEAEACTLDYSPVCGNDSSTYSNACGACSSGNVDTYVAGECLVELSGKWQWDKTTLADGTEYEPEDSLNFTISFDPDDQIKMGVDCNVGGGEYIKSGSKVHISLQSITEAYCGDDSLDTTYLQQISDVQTFLFEDDLLLLEFPADSGVMIFSISR
ncbi:hypothetical protein COB55_03710 [Candidatus Wolfebacteria bacterium]|nr:MAG: hypothetical protein COB55_03710 [Candidatus Wolfebacteria bacterium]